MKLFILTLFIPVSIFAQTDSALLKKNKSRIDSLLNRVDRAATDINHLQQQENVRHADSLIIVVDRLANKLNGDHTLADQAVLKTADSSTSKAMDAKRYFIVIGVYANQKLAQQNKDYHKFSEAGVVKSLSGKYYYLAIPCIDDTSVGNDVKKYRTKYKCKAWWVRL